MTRRIEFGRHSIELGAEGICFMTLVGALELPEAERFVREMKDFQEQHLNVVLILDMTWAVESVRSESRKAIIAGVREKPYPVGFINASFALRALMGLMLNAIRILGTPMPHTFADTEAEARAWAQSVIRTSKAQKS